MRNVKDRNSRGSTPYELRFKRPYTGPLIPFGAEIMYKPASPEDKRRLHPMGRNTLPGVFMGFHQLVSGDFSGDIYYLDWEKLVNCKNPKN